MAPFFWIKKIVCLFCFFILYYIKGIFVICGTPQIFGTLGLGEENIDAIFNWKETLQIEY
jgi:hypothetical protein